MRAVTATILLVFGLNMNMLHAQSGKGSRLRYLPASYEYQHRVTITPVGLVVAYARANTLFGCSYEFMFNRIHGIAFYIPFAFGYRGSEQNLYNNSLLKSSNIFLSTEHISWHIAPGIQVHTGKGQTPVDFSIGPGIVLGKLNAVTRFKSPQYPFETIRVNDSYGLLGLVLDGSLDYTRGHLMAGLFVRLGMLAEQHDFSSFLFAAGVRAGLRY